MKTPLLLLLTLWLTQASAFGLYGAYERIMFWQAYQMDASSTTKMIAKACASETQGISGLGQLVNGRCNFRQFIHYIAGNEDDRAAIRKLSASIETETNVDRLADRLYAAGVRGTYRAPQVYQGVDRADVPTLFMAVADFIGEQKLENGNRLLYKAQVARARVEEGRVAVRNRDVGYLLRYEFDKEHQPTVGSTGEAYDPNNPEHSDRGLPLVTEGLVPEVENRGRGWETVDLWAARENIRKATGKIVKIQEYINQADKLQSGIKDGMSDAQIKAAEKKGHKANIQAITKAKGRMSGACSK